MMNLNTIHPFFHEIPKDNVAMISMVGSRAFDLHTADSDFDAMGFWVPEFHVLYPPRANYVEGFDPPRHMGKTVHKTKVEMPMWGGAAGDVTMYNIVEFFRLAASPSPNVIESLFIDDSKVLHSNAVGNFVRANRQVFLSKEIYPKYTGWAHSYIKKAASGADVNKCYANAVRLLACLESFLRCGSLAGVKFDWVKDIRHGRMTDKEMQEAYGIAVVDAMYFQHGTDLPGTIDRDAVRKVLNQALDLHIATGGK
jgi:hypothetical protein